ncbi:MAG: HAMP domain-containing histidine kinase [Lachnospiraceae bacterium]|nr:HAMP domain-containing histidine kinase [Lachnospiraceae bacterium]
MYRKKRRFFHSILFRISLWILLPGIAGMLLVAYFVEMQMHYYIEKQIAEEMQRVRDNSLLYVRQTLLINDSRMDVAGFELYRNEIEKQLSSAGYREIILCDPEGMLLAGDSKVFGLRKEQEDFARAKEQESAFSVRYGNGGQCEVYFSMPVNLNGQFIGIISSFFDYGELYRGQSDAIERMVWTAVAVFTLICLIIWFTVYRILLPIRKLSRAAGEISAHLADGRQGSMILDKLQFQGRRDEIGELCANYMEMLRVTEEQFQRIREDKERILTLWSSRQEFYNNVTHELKTPLTTISGYAQLMEKNGPGDEELFYIGTEHILKESTRLHRMVVQLLEMQDKADAEDARRLNLAEIVESVTETMKIKANRYDNTLTLKGTKECAPVIGKEDKIRQVLINVIDNAIKYGEPGKPIPIRLTRQAGQVQITVSNQGQGIRKDELETIFEPFYRADKGLSREMGSSGLGLSIAARIMEEHRGRITAASIPGKETVFTISFPAADRKEKV